MKPETSPSLSEWATHFADMEIGHKEGWNDMSRSLALQLEWRHSFLWVTLLACVYFCYWMHATGVELLLLSHPSAFILMIMENFLRESSMFIIFNVLDLKQWLFGFQQIQINNMKVNPCSNSSLIILGWVHLLFYSLVHNIYLVPLLF